MTVSDSAGVFPDRFDSGPTLHGVDLPSSALGQILLAGHPANVLHVQSMVSPSVGEITLG